MQLNPVNRCKCPPGLKSGAAKYTESAARHASNGHLNHQ